MSQVLLTSLALSLLATLALEAGFFWLTGKRNKRDLLLLLLANLVTNPAVVLLLYLTQWFTTLNYIAVTVVLEFSAVFIEGWYYKNYGQEFKRPFLFSLAANAFSFGIGLLLQLIFR
ncbi:MAG: hypothetical protein FWF91_02195 [Coriobacteriia bacterium]|nr:hypothetical protein [Coriobacteriia bacterium]